MFRVFLVALLAQLPPGMVLPPHSVPPAAMRPSVLLRGPQPRASVQSYISPLDYPPNAHGAFGRVTFTATVGPDGHVIGCTIRRSSGSAALDIATCQLIQRRARYVPATDSNGAPVVGTIDEDVDWKSP